MQGMKRTGESGQAPFRTNRFFTVADKWYFSTREGFDSGPYGDKSQAEEGLRRFLKVAKLIPAADEISNLPHRMF